MQYFTYFLQKVKHRSSPLELLKQKHLTHEQELREHEQKRRAAELTLHFEQQIKQQQHQLRLQKKALADKERGVRGDEDGGGRREYTGRDSRKEHRYLEKKHSRDEAMPLALDMSNKGSSRSNMEDMPMNLKMEKKTPRSEMSPVQVGGM